MSKKTLKLISVITIILCVAMTMSTCFALDVTDVDTSDSDTEGSLTGLQNVGSSIATIIRNVGIILAVVILMVLGIKYMMGSAEEKAEYKKTMMPYLVGAVLLFAASAIAGMVVAWSESIGA